MAWRYLYDSEIRVAKPVFKDSLPWDKITLHDNYGAGESLYVTGRNVHVGPEYYRGMDTVAGGKGYLVHELTHVWQHEHGPNRAAYLVGSVAAQVIHGKNAYSFTPGKPWNEYNPEQQAEIVRDWYLTGMSESDKLFPYIRDHIRSKTYDSKTEGVEKMKW